METLKDIINHKLSREYNWLINTLEIDGSENNIYFFTVSYIDQNAEYQKRKGEYKDLSNDVLDPVYYSIDKNSLGSLEYIIKVDGVEPFINGRRVRLDAGMRFRVKRTEDQK